MRLLLLSIVMAVSLLLLGCASAPPAAPPAPAPSPSPAAPSAPAQPNIPAEAQTTPPAVPAEPAPAPPAADGTHCVISLNAKQIKAGDAVSVEVRATAGPGQTASYLCGDKKKSLGSNGLFTHLDLCRFDTPGNITVYVALNDQPCASANLEVVSAAAPAPALKGTCSIVEGTQRHIFGGSTNRYEAQVQYADYVPGSTLSWDCGTRTYRMTLSDSGTLAPSGRATGTVTVFCEYSMDPGPIPSIPVQVNDDVCGDLKS